MSWFQEKRDEFMDWFKSTKHSITDYFKENADILKEWINYKPGQPEQTATKQPMPTLSQPQQSPKQKDFVKELQQRPIIQRGLVNRVEVKFEKSPQQDRER